MKTIKLLIFIALASAFLFSCLEEEDFNAQLITEEVLYVSGEKVQLIARILSLPEQSVSDHGFLISKTEDFGTSLNISLGEINKIGRYFGETGELKPDIHYYCRSYMIIDDQTLYGNIITFNTLLPSILSFEPRIGFPGDIVQIDGANLGTIIEVYFGDAKAEIISLDFESKVTVKVPISAIDINVPISIVVNNEVLRFADEFEYITGKWQKEASFFNAQAYKETLSFVFENNLYFGLGEDAGRKNNPNLWKMNLNSNTWTTTSFQMNSLYPFQTNSYFGGGSTSSLPPEIYSNKFWNFNGIEFIRRSNTPFNLYKAIAFETTDNVIVTGGGIAGDFRESDISNRDMYSYNKLNDSWSLLGEIPFLIDNPTPNFVFNNNFYVFNKFDNAIWEYNTLDNKWNYFIELPFVGSEGGVAAVIGEKVYIGLFDGTKRLWELDMSKQSWKIKVSYTGSILDTYQGHFVFDSKVYLIVNKRKKSQSDQEPIEFWSFDPTKL